MASGDLINYANIWNILDSTYKEQVGSLYVYGRLFTRTTSTSVTGASCCGMSAVAYCKSVLFRSASCSVSLQYLNWGNWVTFGTSSCSKSGAGEEYGTSYGLNVDRNASMLGSVGSYGGCLYRMLTSGSASGSATYYSIQDGFVMNAMSESQYNSFCKGKPIYSCTNNFYYSPTDDTFASISPFNSSYRGVQITTNNVPYICTYLPEYRWEYGR